MKKKVKVSDVCAGTRARAQNGRGQSSLGLLLPVSPRMVIENLIIVSYVKGQCNPEEQGAGPSFLRDAVNSSKLIHVF